MRLPSKLLGQVRVGVGVGAVMLGGCDLAEPVATTTEPDVAAAAESMEPAAPTKHEPMLLSRHVIDAAEEARAKTAEPEARPLRVEVTTPRTEKIEDGEGFVPYVVDPTAEGIIATASPKPRPRVRRPKRERVVDEPCATESIGVGEPSGWDCPACGRG